jgi:hypothetical protein
MPLMEWLQEKQRPAGADEQNNLGGTPIDACGRTPPAN